MSRLQCIGTSSKVPSQEKALAEAVKAEALSSRDAPVNKSFYSQKQPQKPKLSTRPAARHPPANPDRGHEDRMPAQREQNSKTASVQEERRSKRTVEHKPSRSETHDGFQALPPPGDATTRTHGAVTAGAECVLKMPDPFVQVPRFPTPPTLGNARGTREAESGEDEDECDEEHEDPNKFRAPIELLAEFLKAVMERKYTLAKKLCQMILIYEPENPEARHFLALIQQSLLKEEVQKCSSSEDNTSEDDEDDDDDEDDESSSVSSDDDVTDSDEERSCSSSSDGEEEDVLRR